MGISHPVESKEVMEWKQSNMEKLQQSTGSQSERYCNYNTTIILEANSKDDIIIYERGYLRIVCCGWVLDDFSVLIVFYNRLVGISFARLTP